MRKIVKKNYGYFKRLLSVCTKHFLVQRIIGLKNVWSKRSSGPKNIVSKKVLGQKIWLQKNFGSKKFSVKQIWVPKHFGSNKILASK